MPVTDYVAAPPALTSDRDRNELGHGGRIVCARPAGKACAPFFVRLRDCGWGVARYASCSWCARGAARAPPHRAVFDILRVPAEAAIRAPFGGHRSCAHGLATPCVCRSTFTSTCLALRFQDASRYTVYLQTDIVSPDSPCVSRLTLCIQTHIVCGQTDCVSSHTLCLVMVLLLVSVLVSFYPIRMDPLNKGK